jgi:hypothetical protein
MAYGSPEFIKYKAALQRMAAEVYPQAIADTLNQVAGFAHYATAKNIRSRFTLRNRYTEGSLRFYKASPKAKIEKINAVTGSFSEYMVAQDAGGERRPKRGSRAPVVTLAARGGNPAKVVRKKYHAGQLGPGQFVGQPSGQPLGAIPARKDEARPADPQPGHGHRADQGAPLAPRRGRGLREAVGHRGGVCAAGKSRACRC